MKTDYLDELLGFNAFDLQEEALTRFLVGSVSDRADLILSPNGIWQATLHFVPDHELVARRLTDED